MARPQKDGLDYFPLNVVMDDEIKLIDAKFGVAGFGVLVKVWQIIYDHGYYALWTERELLLYKSRINADINFINEVINECLQWGIFSKEMYDKYSVLTSRGIQKRFFEATCRRQTVAITSEVLLMPIPDNYKPQLIDLPIVNVNRNIKNADINPKNADSGTQSKVKESKVKKSINISVPDGTVNHQFLFDYYLSLELVKHKELTPEMKNAIDTARRRGKYRQEDMERLLRRHSLLVKLTADNGEYAIKKRTITEFFGQRVHGGTALVCSEYADDGAKWLFYKQQLEKTVKDTCEEE